MRSPRWPWPVSSPFSLPQTSHPQACFSLLCLLPKPTKMSPVPNSVSPCNPNTRLHHPHNPSPAHKREVRGKIRNRENGETGTPGSQRSSERYPRPGKRHEKAIPSNSKSRPSYIEQRSEDMNLIL